MHVVQFAILRNLVSVFHLLIDEIFGYQSSP
jgi:hypothetical protein